MPTDLVTLDAKEGQTDVTAPPVGYAPTGFTFDAALSGEGFYDAVASGAGAEIARDIDAVEGILATIVSVTPPTNSSDVAQTYVALGTNLADTDEVAWEGPETGSIVPVAGSVTATGFTFDATLGTDGEYAVIAKCQGNEIARLDVAITITTVITVTDVSPDVVYTDTTATITVTGTGLQDVTQAIIEGPENFSFTPVGLTSTSFTVDLTTTLPGLFNLSLFVGQTLAYQEDDVILSVDSTVRIVTVTPTPVRGDTATTYTVTGTNFLAGGVDQVQLVGQRAGTLAPITATVASETSLTFDATLAGVDVYDVNLLAVGAVVAGESQAIQVGAPAGTITAIDPAEWLVNDTQVYTVTGTGLSWTNQVLLRDGADVIQRVFSKTDTSFKFQATFTETEVYNVSALDVFDFEFAELADGLSIVPIGTPTPLTVTPNQVAGQVPLVYTVTGTDLLVTATVNLEGRNSGLTQNARVADKTSTGFTFARNLPAPDIYNLVLLDKAGTEVGRLDSAIIVVDRPPATITRVVPKLVATGVATEIIIYGSHLLGTELVRVQNVAGSTDFTPTDVTPFKITLTATIPASGPYDVILLSGGAEIAREDRALLVTSTPAFFRITPDTVPDDTATSYLVEGICLSQILSCALRGISGAHQSENLQPTRITEHGNTEYSFTIDATLAEPDLYTLLGYPAIVSDQGDPYTARLEDAVTVTDVTAPTGIITDVTPKFVTRGVATDITVVGSTLAAVDSVRLEGMGQAITVAAANVTDTGFTLTATLPNGGQYDLIALGAGTEIAREDDAIRAVVTTTLVAADPLLVPANTQTTFHVLGLGLGVADHISLAGGVTQVITNVPITKLTDFGTQEYRFDFDYALPGPDNFALYVYDATSPNPIASAQHVFYVDAAPLTIDITSVTPATRPERTATTYTVVGTLLSTVDEANLVPTGGGTAIPVTIIGLTDTGFTFDQTLADAGSYDLVLSTAGAEVTREDAAITIIVRPVPDVINLMPNPSLVNVVNNYAAGGTNLGAVDGAYATPSAGGTALPLPITSVTETLIIFDPYTFTATGVYDLTVTEGGVDADNYQDAFSIQDTFNTTLLTVTPDTGASDTTVDVTITYTGQDMTTVLLQPVGGVGARTDATGTVTVPGSTLTATLDLAGLPPGDYFVALCPSGSDLRTNVLPFTVTDAPPPPLPAISAIAPNTAQTTVSTVFTVTGTGLAGTLKVGTLKVGDPAANTGWGDVTSATDTEVVFGATHYEVGPHDVILSADSMDPTAEIARLSGGLTIVPLVVADITTITPASGEVSSTVVFTVAGTGLATTTQVELEGPK